MNSRSKATGKNRAIKEILREIQSVTLKDRWSIPLEFVLELIELSREDYYRYIYSRRTDPTHPHHIREHYDNATVHELVALLSDNGYPETGKLFQKAGYFLTAAESQNWGELFISVSASRIQSHTLDRDFMENALMGCRYREDAFEYYLQALFPLKEMIDYASQIYLTQKKIEDHPLIRKILFEHIRTLIHRKIVSVQELYISSFSILLEKSVAAGLLKKTSSGKEKSRVLSAAQKEALLILEFTSHEIPDRKSLQSRYRQLMKRHHPDRNREGEERSREITGAYQLLLKELYTLS